MMKNMYLPVIALAVIALVPSLLTSRRTLKTEVLDVAVEQAVSRNSHRDHGKPDDTGHDTDTHGDHGKHDDHSHDGDSHGHVHEKPERGKLSLLIAWLLVSFISFLMSIVYIVNSSHARVQMYGFKIFSLILAIFCAILIEKAQHSIIFGVLELCLGHHPRHALEVVVMSVLYLAWFSAITVFSKRYANDPAKLYGIVEGIITHITAFVGIELIVVPLYSLGKHVYDHHGPTATKGLYAGTVAGVIILGVFLNGTAAFIRKRTLQVATHENAEAESTEAESAEAENAQVAEEEEGEDDALNHSWQHIATECEVDSIGIIFGAVFMVFLFVMTNGGNPPPLDCDIAAVQGNPCPMLRNGMSQVISLVRKISLTVVLFLLVVSLLKVLSKFKEGSIGYEIVNTLEALITFSVAWMLSSLVKSITRYLIGGFQGMNAEIWASLVGTKALCLVVIWPIFVLSMSFLDLLVSYQLMSISVADRVVHCLSLTTAVTIESMYGLAVHTIIDVEFEISKNPVGEALRECGFILLLVCIILPALLKYIVPEAMLPLAQRSGEVGRKERARFAMHQHLLPQASPASSFKKHSTSDTTAGSRPEATTDVRKSIASDT